MDFTVFDMALIPIATGLVEVIKKLKVIESKHLPIVALVTGIILGLGYLPEVYDADGIRFGILAGIYIGLASSGLHSGYDAMRGKKDKDS